MNKTTPTKKTPKEKEFIPISKTLGIEQIQIALPEAGFVEQKSNKELRKKQVQEKIFGIKELKTLVNAKSFSKPF